MQKKHAGSLLRHMMRRLPVYIPLLEATSQFSYRCVLLDEIGGDRLPPTRF